MSLQVFPALRYVNWAVHKRMNWSNIVNRSTSGGRLSVPLWPNNPLWDFEWTYEVVLNDPAKLSFKGAPNNNTLYTDLQILEAFYFMMKGTGNLFVYQPPDSVVVGQPLADPDANGNSELVHTIGAVPSSAGLIVQNESVQELNGGTPTIHHTGGTVGSILAPGTTSPYEGYVVHWSANPTPGTITADYTYFYRCGFSEDIQDYEQFAILLWQLQSLKFEQIRVTAN